MNTLGPPVRAVTGGGLFHWFGYYDKFQFDPTDRYVLGMEVAFEHRSPEADDEISVGMVDLGDGDRWIELGRSRAWCWQQGCMLQWRPGSRTEVIWNDREGDRYVCHILDVRTGRKRTVPFPIYSVSPDGRSAVAPDFSRVNHMRPGYGYAGIPDPWRDTAAPKDSGIFRIDLEKGERELIVSIADVAEIPYPHGDLGGATHYFNHLLFNPDGSRFEFLHRWRTPEGGWGTRMLTAAPDGSDVHVVVDSGYTSHFIWRDPRHILAWAEYDSQGRHFYLFRDRSREVEVVGEGVMTEDGHVSYLPGADWMVNDTYPDENRERELYLFHVPTGRKFSLGKFFSPPEYKGEWRCDLHPRFSRDGRRVVVDSPHGGNGRQMYMIDVGAILDSARPR